VQKQQWTATDDVVVGEYLRYDTDEVQKEPDHGVEETGKS